MWDLPNVPTAFGKVVGAILNDWRLAGVWTAGSGAAYDLGFSYKANGGSVNLTGSPDYGARIVYVGDPGSGCSDDQYRQFNVSAVTGPGYNSVGLESGRNLLRGCPDKRVDMALSRDIRMGGGRVLEFRLDVFNVFNTVIITGRQTPDPVQQPDRPDDPQPADAGRRFARSGAPGAAQRRLRRGDRRAGPAQHADPAPVRVLDHSPADLPGPLTPSLTPRCRAAEPAMTPVPAVRRSSTRRARFARQRGTSMRRRNGSVSSDASRLASERAARLLPLASCPHPPVASLSVVSLSYRIVCSEV